MSDKIISILFLSVISLFSLTVHEFAHGYIAYRLGDDTAKQAGRLTLNPLKHIDPFGLLAMIFFRIGWAKPVPVNPYRLKNGQKDMFIVALAGPIANMVLAALFSVLLHFLYHTNALYPFLFCYLGVVLNVGYAVFNLLPIPPLDGSRFLFLIKNEKIKYYIVKYEKYSFVLLFILMKLGLFSYLIEPIIDFFVNVMV